MKRRKLALLIGLSTSLVLAVAAEAQVTRVRVNCNHGGTIAGVLANHNAPNLEIVVTGLCKEKLVRIGRDAVTIRGAIGGGAVLEGTFVVDGASNVTIKDLSVRKGEDSCIIIRHNAGAVVRNTTLEDCGNRGILLEGSAATIVDTTIRRVGTVGILNRNSRVELDRNIHVSEAGVACISATDGAVIYLNPDNHPATVLLERSLLGLVSQLSSEITLAEGTVIARNNQLAGILAASQGVVVHGTAVIESKDNDTYGLYLDELSSWSPFVGFGATVTITGNGSHGIFVERGSALELTNATVIANNGGKGIKVDNGILRINGTTVNEGNATGDVALTFGTRAELGTGNAMGSLTCDDTVMLRGGGACAPLAPEAAQRSTDEIRALIAKARAAAR